MFAMGALSMLSCLPQILSSLFLSLDYAHPQRSTARDGLVLSMVLVITARGGDLFTEAGSSLSVSVSTVTVCVRTRARMCVFRYCMKTPCRPLCHYNRFGSSFCKIEHAYPDHTHTPSCATRVALCGSHTPWCAEQRRKNGTQARSYPHCKAILPFTHSSPTG